MAFDDAVVFPKLIMLMDKKELRASMTRNKKETSRAAILDLSGPILRRLAVHPRFIAARTVLLYHSLPDEVDTQDFVRYWSLRKCILLPTVKGKEIELQLKTGSKRGLSASKNPPARSLPTTPLLI